MGNFPLVAYLLQFAVIAKWNCIIGAHSRPQIYRRLFGQLVILLVTGNRLKRLNELQASVGTWYVVLHKTLFYSLTIPWYIRNALALLSAIISSDRHRHSSTSMRGVSFSTWFNAGCYKYTYSQATYTTRTQLNHRHSHKQNNAHTLTLS